MATGSQTRARPAGPAPTDAGTLAGGWDGPDWWSTTNLRWVTLAVGAAFAAPGVAGGRLDLLVGLSVVLAVTAFRTARPLPPGPPDERDGMLAVADVVLVGAAMGVSGGLLSPFLPSLVVAIAVAAAGYGATAGLLAAAAGTAAALGLASAAGPTGGAPDVMALTVLAAGAVLPGLARARPAASPGPLPGVDEVRRLEEETWRLAAVTDLGRALPTNLDLEEVLDAIADQLARIFDAERIIVLGLDDERWYPELARGVDLGSAAVFDHLPRPLADALAAPTVARIGDLSAVCERHGSGLYARLVVDGEDQGLVGVERSGVDRYDDRAVELFESLSEVVALSIDNARAFGRSRSLAAAEERARIARDLHDRLGQWLTYIALELERVTGSFERPEPELERLQGDVRSAIDELRDALVELRTTVRTDRPLAVVLPEVVGRFGERTSLEVRLDVPTDPSVRLSGVVEGELLRIVQESLTNIEKHADARTVHISWSVDEGRGILTIEDDGRGFDPGRGIRSTAYGLVGMRERAAAVGAILEIASQRGDGTVVTVLVGTTEENRT